jgi:hypothetical protein
VQRCRGAEVQRCRGAEVRDVLVVKDDADFAYCAGAGSEVRDDADVQRC